MPLLQLSHDEFILYNKVIDLDDDIYPVNFDALCLLLDVGDGPLRYLKQRPDEYKFINRYQPDQQRRAKLDICTFICSDAECDVGHNLWKLFTRLGERSIQVWPKPGQFHPEESEEDVDVNDEVPTTCVEPTPPEEPTKLAKWLSKLLSAEQMDIYISMLRTTRADDFAVDLDELWRQLGLVSKANAKKTLKAFKAGVDYSVRQDPRPKSQPGRPKQKQRLTLQTAQQIVMRSKSDKAETVMHVLVTALEGFQTFPQPE